MYFSIVIISFLYMYPSLHALVVFALITPVSKTVYFNGTPTFNLIVFVPFSLRSRFAIYYKRFGFAYVLIQFCKIYNYSPVMVSCPIFILMQFPKVTLYLHVFICICVICVSNVCCFCYICTCKQQSVCEATNNHSWVRRHCYLVFSIRLWSLNCVFTFGAKKNWQHSNWYNLVFLLCSVTNQTFSNKVM